VLKIGSEELHVMLDLETLSTNTDAVITQIGGCLFQPGAVDPIKHKFSYFIDPASALNSGMQIDWSAVRWWLGQSDEARAPFLADSQMTLRDALIYLQRGNWQNVQCVWSHGAGFDIPILEWSFKKLKLSYPWSYKAVRDTRTLFWLCPDVQWPENPLKHSAVDDAVTQALAVTDALRKLGAVDMPKETTNASQ